MDAHYTPMPAWLTPSLKRGVACGNPSSPSSPTLDPVCKSRRRTSGDEMQLRSMLRCQSLGGLSDGSLTPPSTPTDCGSDDTMQVLHGLDSESPTAASARQFFCPSEAGDDSDDQQPLRELLQLVRQHQQQLVFNGAQPALLEHLMTAALGDTDAALTVAMSAMDLATTMCAHGSPEAADRALALAEQTLQLTVQKLAKAQVLVAAEEQLQLGASAAAAAPEHSTASPFVGDDDTSSADSNWLAWPGN